jgi:hypothetical protein
LRKAEALLVLLAATVDVAKWKEDIAPQVMDAREFGHHVVALGSALRVRKKIECFLKAFAHPKTLRQSQLCLTNSNLVGRRGYRQPIGCNGRSDIAEIALQFTLEADQGVTVSIGLRNLQAATSQPECGIDMKGRALSVGRSEVCVGGPGVLGAIEVLCMQRKVLVREPLRSLKVQFPATGSKQGGVSALLDKCMSEQEVITLRQYQGVADEAVTDIVRFVDEMPQQSEIKTLADNRCSLKRLPVTLRQPVHARKD